MTIAKPLIARREERRFSRTRTVVLSVALTAAAIALHQGLGGAGHSTGGASMPGGGTPR